MTLLRTSLPSLAVALTLILGVALIPDLASAQTTYGIQNPLNGINSISEFFKRLFDAAIMIGIPIAVFFIILSGFRFIAAQGNQEKLTDARRNFMYTVIGIAIFIGAWALSQLIAGTLRSIGVNV
jgi:hypothetical protein